MYNQNIQLDDSLIINTLDASTCESGINHGMDNNPYHVKSEYTDPNSIQEKVKDFTFDENKTFNEKSSPQSDILGIHSKPKKYVRPRKTLSNENSRKFFENHDEYVNKRIRSGLPSFKNEEESTLDDILIKEAWQYSENDSWGVASFISGEINTLFPKIKKLEMSIQIDNPVKEGTIYETRTYTYSQ
jgi:hypothetical protein